MKTKWITGLTAAAALGAACGGTSAPGDTVDKSGGFDISPVLADGKGDMAGRAKLLDELPPDATVRGAFEPGVRVYGYVVEARKGARLTVSLDAKPGEDASVAEDRELDTIMAVYGPYHGRSAPGRKLAEVDDGPAGVAAPPVDFDVDEDGKYLVAFSSWDDAGEGGAYEIDIACQGTDFQCRRPERDRPCEEGQLYIQGATRLDEDATWEKCEVIVLEDAIVGPDAVLSIVPGVEVKSNFLRANDENDLFGTVGLDVHGTLQAVGTSEHPVRFTSLTPDGWRGVTLRGDSNVVRHALFENAGTGVEIVAGASAEISDVVIDGLVRRDGPGQSRGTQGILVHEDSSAVFSRGVIKNFAFAGFRSTGGDHVVIEDSILHSNAAGVRIEGANASTSCRTRVREPERWRDPVIRHTDIYDNTHGILVVGSDELLQIEHSNIVDNQREAVLIQGTALHQDSFIRNTNILRNGRGEVQVRSYHRTGIVDISQNYWEDISDPHLSANWDSRCGGEIFFTGFHPRRLDAGPRLDTLVDDVKRDSLAARQEGPPGGNENGN